MEEGDSRVPLAAPPDSLEEILAGVEGFRRRIYAEVRAIVDDMERVAPWEDLLVPSSDRDTFLRRTRSFLRIAQTIPAHLEEASGSSEISPSEEITATLEEARFYFGRIHEMVADDVGRLDQEVRAFPSEAAEPDVVQAAMDRLAELTVDLKGKYTSALMGAAASLVAEGRWDGAATAVELFPEKRAEQERSQLLLDAVRDAIELIRNLPYDVDLLSFYERWGAEKRVEKHALTELLALEWRVGKLLQADLRLALYSGDFQAIQLRSEALARATQQLAELHSRTWGGRGVFPPDKQTYPTLLSLLMEIAAIVDRELLEILLGRGQVRTLAESAQSADDESPAIHRVPPTQRHLIPWFRHVDLHRFLEILRVNVQRRAILRPSAEPSTEPSAPVTPSDAAGAKAVDAKEAPEVRILPHPPLDFALPRELGRPEGEGTAVTQSSDIWDRPEPLTDAEQGRLLEDLAVVLSDLRSPGNRDWQTVLMFRRLLAKHRQVPPALMQGIQSFVYQVTNDLVPLIHQASTIDSFPPAAGPQLMALCLELSRPDLSMRDMSERIPTALDRFTRLLDALGATTRSLQANRRR